MTAVETAIEKWKLEGVALEPPLEESVVKARFSALGRVCSRDVLALYTATGGMEDGYSDSHLWSLWPLQKVVLETARYGKPYILFADFFIDSHLYCFMYQNEEKSSVGVDYLNGEEPELVAASVQEFFELLDSDAARLRMFASASIETQHSM
jgi:hypothetical protein